MSPPFLSPPPNPPFPHQCPAADCISPTHSCSQSRSALLSAAPGASSGPAAAQGAADAAASSAIEYIFAGARRHGVDGKGLAAALAKQSDLSQAAIEIVAGEYAGYAAKVRGVRDVGGVIVGRGSTPLVRVRVHCPCWFFALPQRSLAHMPPQVSAVPLPRLLFTPFAQSGTTAPPHSAPKRAAELLGVEWALGVPVTSSSSSVPTRPYVSVQMRVKYEDGTTGLETVEMSVPQLKAFETSLREAAAALEVA
jgi:hypothetical protein